MTFWNVDHDPYWLSLGGLSSGLSVEIDFAPIVGVEIFPTAKRVIRKGHCTWVTVIVMRGRSLS
jgi:hypothetical protein